MEAEFKLLLFRGFLVNAALNFSLYCGGFGSLECAASPALCSAGWLQARPSTFPDAG